METLKTFQVFVDEITSSNSRLFKESVLTKYKDDEAVKYYLNFIYNPYIITGLSEKKLERLHLTEYVDYIGDTFKSAREALEYVQTHNTGRFEDITELRRFYLKCFNFDSEQFEKTGYATDTSSIFEKLLKKDFTLGITSTTINKVIPGLIPEFNVMLANKYFDNPTIVEGHEFALTTKIDGGRIIAIKENGEVSFFTRAGQRYEGLIDLEEDLRKIPFDNFVFDGELTLLDKGTLTSKDQYKETMKISRKDGIKHGLKMLVFDYLPVESFRKQSCGLSYKERRQILDSIFSHSSMTFFVELPILYQGKDTSKIAEWLNYNIAHGEEGIMINMVNARYEYKRSNVLLKVKKMNDLDLEVIGFEEGTNRHAGRLGALLVNYKGYTVKVGSGFSDELRDEIWRNKDEYLGTIVEVSYFEETSNQDGGISLRFPVFKDFRPDKIEEGF